MLTSQGLFRAFPKWELEINFSFSAIFLQLLINEKAQDGFFAILSCLDASFPPAAKGRYPN
jgi:hypothetical protein